MSLRLNGNFPDFEKDLEERIEILHESTLTFLSDCNVVRVDYFTNTETIFFFRDNGKFFDLYEMCIITPKPDEEFDIFNGWYLAVRNENHKEIRL